MKLTQNIPGSTAKVGRTPASPDRFHDCQPKTAVRNQTPKPKDAGVVTVEAALVVPILLLLTFGLIEYGWLFLKAQDVSNAARRGARVAVRADVTAGEVVSAIQDMMLSAELDGSGYQVNITPANVSTVPPGDIITVEVVLPYSNISLTGTPLVPVPANVQASVSMAKEGP